MLSGKTTSIYLTVIILSFSFRPSLVASPSESKDKKDEPLFIVLDSLGGTKSGAVTNIRHYLAQEYRTKISDVDGPDFNAKQMRTIRPKKPEQENYSDCGIFLLQYVEEMFKSMPQFYWQETIEEVTETWFERREEFSSKRKQIAELIVTMSRDRLSKANQQLPTLMFEPRGGRSKSRRPCFDDVVDDQDDDSNDVANFSFAAAGFYGERSGLRSQTSREPSSSFLADVHTKRIEEDQEQKKRDREARAKRRQDEASKVGFTWKNLCSIL